jgi:cytochrome P450
LTESDASPEVASKAGIPAGAEPKSVDAPTIGREVVPVRVRGVATLWYFLRMLNDPISCVRSVFERYGSLVAFESFALHRRGDTVLAVGAEFNKAVLGDITTWRTGPLPVSGPKGSALDRLGQNLVSLNGPRQTYYRKLLSQPIRSSHMAQLGDDMGQFVAGGVASWPEGLADLWPLSKHLVRSVAVAMLFGGDQARGAALAELSEQLMVESKTRQVYLCRAGFPGKAFKKLQRRAEQVERCALDFAETKRGVLNERDMLSVLVNSPDETGATPSPDIIAGQIPILFGATHETCQTALAWTLFLIAQHPDVARDLVDEISGALAGAPPTLSRVAHLPLLDAVVKESMRILPPVPNLARVASQSTSLGGYDVRRGTWIVLSSFLTNRAPELYDEPARFAPERWSRITPSGFEYMVFSGGPRVCPGSSFGTAVVKVSIAAILSRFCISIVPGARIDRRVAVTMAPRGLPVVLHPPGRGWTASPVTGQVCDMVELGLSRAH